MDNPFSDLVPSGQTQQASNPFADLVPQASGDIPTYAPQTVLPDQGIGDKVLAALQAPSPQWLQPLEQQVRGRLTNLPQELADMGRGLREPMPALAEAGRNIQPGIENLTSGIPNTPLIPLDDSKPYGFGTEFEKQLAHGLAPMLSPRGAAQLPFYAIPGVAEGVGVEALPQTGGNISDAVAAYLQGNTDEAQRKLADATLSAGMAVPLFTKHGVARAFERETPKAAPELPQERATSPASASEAAAAAPENTEASSVPESQTARVSAPTVDDLNAAIREGRLDDAVRISAELERAQKPLQPEPAAATIPAQEQFQPQNEPRPTDQALEQPAGQPAAAPEQRAGVGTGAAQGAGEPVRAPAGTSNRLNEALYGEQGVPSGKGVDTLELLDNARASIRSGSVDPYSILSRTRTKGIANAEEYAALAAEHERLVNEAVAKEKAGAPDAGEAAKAANDFANAIQPHKTAASDLMRLFQGDLNYDLSTTFGMDQYMKAELGRNMKPSERPVFERRARGIRQAETGVADAVNRSDVRVRNRYAKVRDIPIEEAAERVRQFMKDCQV